MPRASKSSGNRGGGGGNASAGNIRAGGAFVELFTKDTALEKGLKNASAKLKSWSETVGKLAAKSFTAGAAILTPITALFAKAIGRSENIGDLADVFGLSTESASKLTSAYEIAGGSVEDLQMALGKLAKSNVTGQPLDEYFLEVADSLREVDDASERFRQASEIFGGKFARKFIDDGFDVADLLNSAPVTSKENITAAKELRMEWTRLGIVLQNATLPIMKQVGPVFQRISAFMQENAGYIPAIAGVGAGLIGIGVALYGLSTALSIGSTGLALLGAGLAMVTSPLGILTLGATAALTAWVAFTDRGASSVASFAQESVAAFGRISESWAAIKEALGADDLQLAFGIALASINVEWVKFNYSMENRWALSLGNMKEAIIAWKYAIKDIWTETSDFLGQAIANAGEAAGALPTGTGAKLEEMRKFDRDKRRADAVAESQKLAMENKAKIAAAEAERKTLIDRSNDAKRIGGFDFEIGKSPGKLGIGDGAVGAFSFGNAGQFFNGGGMQERLLKEAEAQNKKLQEILTAFRNVPLARL